MTEAEANEVICLLVDGLPALCTYWSKGQMRRTAAVYRGGLLDLDFETAKATASRLLLTATKFPTIAEIRAECATVQHGEHTTGAEAWGKVYKAKREQGAHRTPGIDFSFSDPITRQIVADFGWNEICSSQLPDSVRARFIDAYEAMQRRERRRAQLSPGAVNPALPAARDRDQRSLGDVLHHHHAHALPAGQSPQRELPAPTNERSPR